MNQTAARNQNSAKASSRKTGSKPERPVIFEYGSISEYLAGMLAWKKSEDPEFSVRRETRAIGGLSPALVTQLARGKRKLTRDRVPMIARLLDLKKAEAVYLDQWVTQARLPKHVLQTTSVAIPHARPSKRAPLRNHLFQDWAHLYVKDAASICRNGATPAEIHRILGGLGQRLTPQRIARSLAFLQREGFLRRTLDGRLVPQNRVETTADGVPHAKIRAFHKKALEITRQGIDTYPAGRRRANALILSLTEKRFEELKDLLKEAYERILQFMEEGFEAQERSGPEASERLYQVLIHLTPLGGSNEPA